MSNDTMQLTLVPHNKNFISIHILGHIQSEVEEGGFLFWHTFSFKSSASLISWSRSSSRGSFCRCASSLLLPLSSPCRALRCSFRRRASPLLLLRLLLLRLHNDQIAPLHLIRPGLKSLIREAIVPSIQIFFECQKMKCQFFPPATKVFYLALFVVHDTAFLLHTEKIKLAVVTNLQIWFHFKPGAADQIISQNMLVF